MEEAAQPAAASTTILIARVLPFGLFGVLFHPDWHKCLFFARLRVFVLAQLAVPTWFAQNSKNALFLFS